METKDFAFDIDFDSFKDYFLCKAFDVIGNGSYKAHVIKCKDNHDAWAVSMHKSISAVNECLRQLHILFQKIDFLPNQYLSLVSKDLLQTTSPPICSAELWGVCGISGLHTSECVNVVCSGRSVDTFTMHKKYFVFFKYFWFVLKLDHIIRSLMRYWIVEKQDEVTGMSKSEQCSHFSKTYNVEKYYTIFNASMKHVSESLLLYMEHYELLSPMQTLIENKKNEKKERKRKL